MADHPVVAFAGDRLPAVGVLRHLVSNGVEPHALLLPSGASHSAELRALCSELRPEAVIVGTEFREPPAIEFLDSLGLDFLICVHFPHLVPPTVLEIPRRGCLNLHPAYLPYNRGWHTATWAILEGTPLGATLHLMDEGIDTGDIIHQRELPVGPADTADDIYPRLFALEVEVFAEAWPRLVNGSLTRQPQSADEGTLHRKRDLTESRVQCLDLIESISPADLIDRLRALTTNRLEEAAYFEADGRRYRVQVQIVEEPR